MAIKICIGRGDSFFFMTAITVARKILSEASIFDPYSVHVIMNKFNFPFLLPASLDLDSKRWENIRHFSPKDVPVISSSFKFNYNLNQNQFKNLLLHTVLVLVCFFTNNDCIKIDTLCCFCKRVDLELRETKFLACSNVFNCILNKINIHWATDHVIPARRPDLIIINKRKRIWKIVDFAVPADHRINLKESEKKDKYLDIARELKKLWNMKVTIVPIVIGALGTVTKGLLKGLEDLEVSGRVETIQTTALLRTARILRRVLETWGDLLSLKLQWKTIS